MEIKDRYDKLSQSCKNLKREYDKVFEIIEVLRKKIIKKNKASQSVINQLKREVNNKLSAINQYKCKYEILTKITGSKAKIKSRKLRDTLSSISVLSKEKNLKEYVLVSIRN